MSEPSAKAIEVADRILDTWMHECAYHAGMPAADYCTCREEQSKLIAGMIDDAVRDVHEKLAKEAKSLRAEVAELERAVREEGDRVFGLVANHLTRDAIEKMVAAIRARGKEAGGE